MTEKLLIDCLGIIAEQLKLEAQTKQEWGHFGNALGRSESRMLLKVVSEMLASIAAAI